MHIQIPYNGTRTEEFLKNIGYFSTLFVAVLGVSYIKGHNSNKGKKQVQTLETRSNGEKQFYYPQINNDEFYDLGVWRDTTRTISIGNAESNYEDSLCPRNNRRV